MALTVAAVALVVAGIRAWLVGRWTISREVWIAVMQKTLRAGDRGRALKLGNAVASPVGDAMKAAILTASALDAEAKSTEAEETIRKAYEHGLDPLKLVGATRPLSILSLLLAAFGAWTAWKDGAPLASPLSLAGLSLAAVVWAEVKSVELLGTGPAALEAVLPLLLPGAGGGAPYRDHAEPEPLAGVQVRVRRLGHLVKSIPLDDLPIVKIGRHERSHVCLDHPTVSRMHAVLEHDGHEAWDLIDLGAGTRVRGESVNKVALKVGDRFEIGPFELELARGAAPVEEPAETTDVLFYGFDDRAPDLFFEAVSGALRDSRVPVEVRVHTREVAPRAVVSLWGERDSLERARELLTERGDALYERFTTPRDRILPDATYGPETRLHAVLLTELASKTPDRTS